MNRVTKRTWLMGLFVLLLVGGMVFFVMDYWHNASQWISAPGSPHVSNRTNIGVGTITDRGGSVLLDMGLERTYSSNESTRKSTLHWVGDRQGKISAGAVTSYTGAMVGFDPVNGIYSATGMQRSNDQVPCLGSRNCGMDCLRITHFSKKNYVRTLT